MSSNILWDGDNSALVANYLTQMSTMFSQNNNNCIRHGLSVRMGRNYHTPYTEAFGLGTAGLETCARICKLRNARFTHDTELSKLVFSNKTLMDCQGWTFTLFNSTCFLAAAWDNHKFITGMDYTSQIVIVIIFKVTFINFRKNELQM